MTKRYSLTVRGNNSTWSFEIEAKPEHVADWLNDGLEVGELCNTIPVWVQQAGLTKLWCRLQDLFYLRFEK